MMKRNGPPPEAKGNQESQNDQTFVDDGDQSVGEGAALPVQRGRNLSELGGLKRGLLGGSLQELGKIKIGKKSDVARTSQAGTTFYAPEKIDHFLVVKNEKDHCGCYLVDSEIMAKLGEKPRELEIAFLSNDIQSNFMTYLGLYASRQCVCYGNGEEAWRLQTRKEGGRQVVLTEKPRISVPCPCHLLDERGKCKRHGVLSVILLKSPVIGGIYRFRTTSRHSISNILNSLELISVLTGGTLVGLPFVLTLTPVVSDVVSPNGTVMPTTFYAANVLYKGDACQLMASAVKEAERRLTHTVSVRQLEEKARLLLTSASVESTSDAAEIQEEFFPEQTEIPE